MMSKRRAQLLDIAAQLMAERGYHAVGMDDIGEVAGVSGPALYRHFKSKQQMLGEILIEPSERLTRAAQVAMEETRSPIGALEKLVDFHMRFTGAGVNIPRMYYRCVDEMAAEDRSRLEALLADYIQLWIQQILKLRPDLDIETARAAVMALFRIFNLPHGERLKAAEHHDDLMGRMAKAALQGLLNSPEVPAPVAADRKARNKKKATTRG